MRRLIAIAMLGLITGCSTPAEPELFTTSVDIDETALPQMLEALDQLTDNDLDVGTMQALAVSTPMDEEQQLRLDASYSGEDTSILYHVWREQEDWIHVYASSESESLIEAIKVTMTGFARE